MRAFLPALLITAQEIFGIAESEADATPHGKIGFDSRNHRITPARAERSV